MFHAVGEAGIHRFAAKMEVRFARMPHRPFANPLSQIQQSRLAGNFRAGFCRHQSTGRGRGNGCLLISRPLTQEPSRPHRNDARLRRGRRLWRGSSGRPGGAGRRNCWHRSRLLRRRRWCRSTRCLDIRHRSSRRRLARSGRRLLRIVVRLDRRRARLQAQAVRLADHRITADAAQFVRDLARGQPALPHRLELVDPFIGPGQ